MAEPKEKPAQTDDTAAEVQATIGLLVAAPTVPEAMTAVATLTGLSVVSVTAAWAVLSNVETSALPKGIGLVLPDLRYASEVGRYKMPTAVIKRQNTMYSVAFFLAAARRLMEAAKLGTEAFKRQVAQERIYWSMHRKANRKRSASADLVSRTAGQTGFATILGWSAAMDDRTSAECRAADGRNFYVAKPPMIGYPGAVHPHCRCKPVPPYPGAKMVDDSVTVRRHRGLGSAF